MDNGLPRKTRNGEESFKLKLICPVVNKPAAKS